MIPDSFIEELKYRTDIEQLIGGYVPLKRSGRNLTGLCPFHSEKSPSFVVYNDSQSYFCFGCGAGGDAISFVKNIEHLDYLESVKFLAQRAGLTVPDDGKVDPAAQLKSRILELNREAAHYFHNMLLSPLGEQGMSYLTQRGLSFKTIRRFGLGFAPDGWSGLKDYLLQKGFTLNEMVQGSVVTLGRSGGGYDTFRNRVIFPIIDLRGNVIGFGGRILGEGQPKYLNSGDTPVFKKSRGLFAMNIAKATKEPCLILAEGYMDVISVVQAGFDNVVATLGTALTPEQARLIAQYTQLAVIAYDTDEAGKKATKRAVQLLAQAGVKTKVLVVTGAKDPDEFIKKHGPQRFKLLVEGSWGSTDYEIHSIKSRYDLESEEGRVAYLKEFCIAMAQLENKLEAEIYINREAREIGVSKQAVLEMVESIRKSKEYKKKKQDSRDLRVYAEQPPSQSKDPDRSKHIKYAIAEDKLIVILMRNPDYFRYIKGTLSPQDFVTQKNRELFEVLYLRLSAGQSIEPMVLSQYLDDSQISRLSWIMAANEVAPGSKEDLEQYINVILSYKTQRSSTDVADMSQEEWLEYMKNLSAGKK